MNRAAEPALSPSSASAESADPRRAPIRLLPADLREKIAAGEVIERPASVVKELIENALDAGARTLWVEIEEGGRRRIRVRDDGLGIPRQELVLAVSAHATSKIASEEELARVGTLGFRGEALASIGRVSRLRLVSKVRTEAEGAEVVVEGGRIEGPRPCAAREGTLAEVENLFFNLPARRKFMRKEATEAAHIQEVLAAYAVGRLDVSFEYGSGGRTLWRIPAGADLEERICRLWEGAWSGRLAELRAEVEGYSVWGRVGHPSSHRSDARRQLFFLNGRLVRDRLLLHAVAEAHRGLVPKGRHPAAVLFLRVPVEEVDVNVHPAKREVRFHQSQLVHRLVSRALEQALRDGYSGDRILNSVESRGPASEVPEGSGACSRKADGETGPCTGSPTKREAVRVPGQEEWGPFYKEALRESAPPVWPEPGEGNFIQVHNTFIVLETSDGFEVFDQHALHERILYQQMRLALQRRQVERQGLLAPEWIECTPVDKSLLPEMQALLAPLGFDVGASGEGLEVRAVPSTLPPGELHPFFGRLFERFREEGVPEPDRLREETVRWLACRSAVKAGDRLTRREIAALLDQKGETPFAYSCQHGRPTSISFTVRELERAFYRK
jgi:DNA mismatch repair protein MutL